MIHRLIIISLLIFVVGCRGSETLETFNPKSSVYFHNSDKLIDIDGLHMRYRDEGPREGPVLVMIHGFTSSLESWDGVASELSKTYRVIRMDLPGHGLTGPDPQSRYTNAQTVAFIAKLIDRLEIDPAVVIGNSLGGLTAWRYAASHPERVSSLVLISPGGYSINGVTDEPVAVSTMVKFYLTKAPEAGVKQALSALYGKSENVPTERYVSFRELMKTPGNGEAFVTRAANFTLPNPEPVLKTLDVPTLLIWGDKDVMVPVTHGEKFSKVMPNAELLTYSGIGHIPQEEIPERVASDIRKFLGKQSQ